jgi:porphobilinogen synthase
MEGKIFSGTQRRLRLNPLIRSLVNPLGLSHQQFILPIFVEENLVIPRPIQHMESVSVQTMDTIIPRIEEATKAGIFKFLLFPVPATKKENPDDFNFAVKTIKKIKSHFGEKIWLAVDICLCSYTTHGHCGILNSEKTEVLNHESVSILAEYSILVAKAGADCLAPSDMMDGRIKAIRDKLDESQLYTKSIMAYSAKFTSQYYGPFRDACHSSPTGSKLKDRKSYQLSPFNPIQALAAAVRDEAEGADIIMVKPAGLYTDIIYRLKNEIQKPIAAYHVSGEYAAIEIMAERGILDRANAHLESWAAMQRSGATIIITYAAEKAKEWISDYEY